MGGACALTGFILVSGDYYSAWAYECLRQLAYN